MKQLAHPETVRPSMTQMTPKQVLKSAHERRKSGDRRRPAFDYPSNFVAQVLTTHNHAQPQHIKPARNGAVEAYATATQMDVARAPAGLTHAKTV
jgi:hypothetical protein